jgi:hypothetical protein
MSKQQRRLVGSPGQPKTARLAGHLRSLITVTPDDEELDLFVTRITRWHLPFPALVINGIHQVEPRHLVQQLWPDVLVDMAPTTSQVIVNQRGDAGQWLLGAFAVSDTEPATYSRSKRSRACGASDSPTSSPHPSAPRTWHRRHPSTERSSRQPHTPTSQYAAISTSPV